MPKFHYACAIILFVVSPIFNIVLYIVVLSSGAESGAMFGYMTFCTFLTVLILIWFFTNLLDEFNRVKMDYQKT